jgi:hypothetical protein
MAARSGGREAAARPLLFAKMRFSPPPPRSGGHCTQPRLFRRATLRPQPGRPSHRLSAPDVLRLLWRACPQRLWRPSARRPRLLLAPGSRHLRNDVGRHLGAAVSVHGLRAHDESAARLAAPVSVVCRHRNHRSSLPPCRLRRSLRGDRGAVRPAARCHGLAQPLPLAQSTADLSLPLGLARPEDWRP